MAKLPKSIIRKYGISKKAWQVFRGRSSPSRTRSVKPMARRRRSYRPWRRRRGRGARTIPLIPVATTLGVVGYNFKRGFDMAGGDMMNGAIFGADQVVQSFTGFSFVQPELGFNGGWMMRGLVPVVVSVLAHKVLGMLGANRAFTRLPAPLNKLRL